MNLDTVAKRDAAKRRLRLVQKDIIRKASRKVTPEVERLMVERDFIIQALREQGERA